VNSYAWLDQAVILPEVNIGRRARLSKVIVDRGVDIPEGLIVGEDPELDARRFERTPGGVCLISREMIDALG
jgi:glucose-1-phosphate adenylyltransferase